MTELNQKQINFCEEYLKTGSIKETAEALGIGRTTCHEYMKQPEVKAYLEKVNQEIEEEMKEQLKVNFYNCFVELNSIINGGMFISDNNKLKAIEIYLKYYETIFNKNKQIQE